MPRLPATATMCAGSPPAHGFAWSLPSKLPTTRSATRERMETIIPSGASWIEAREIISFKRPRTGWIGPRTKTTTTGISAGPGTRPVFAMKNSASRRPSASRERAPRATPGLLQTAPALCSATSQEPSSTQPCSRRPSTTPLLEASQNSAPATTSALSRAAVAHSPPSHATRNRRPALRKSTSVSSNGPPPQTPPPSAPSPSMSIWTAHRNTFFSTAASSPFSNPRAVA